MRIEQIRQALADRNAREVARACGVSYQTVIQIRSGKQENPKYQTLKALSEHLRQ